MTKYKVLISQTAQRQLLKLDKNIQNKITAHLKELEISPFEKRPKADIKKLHVSFDPIFFRVRVGKYRVIYSIDKNNVLVTEIISREKGYKWLE